MVLIPPICLAQSKKELGLLPSLNINKKFSKDWSVNVKTESRQSVANESSNYEYVLTDFSFIVAKKTSLNTTISGGYLMRFREREVVNRTIQQITLVKRYSSLRLAHRIVTDQTFQENADTEIRLRYRLSTEIPLSGESLDPNEFFLKLSNEYLNALEGPDYDLEIRSGSFVGHAFSLRSKLELGLDYRIGSFLNEAPRSRFWIGLNYYLTI